MRVAMYEDRNSDILLFTAGEPEDLLFVQLLISVEAFVGERDGVVTGDGAAAFGRCVQRLDSDRRHHRTLVFRKPNTGPSHHFLLGRNAAEYDSVERALAADQLVARAIALLDQVLVDQETGPSGIHGHTATGLPDGLRDQHGRELLIPICRRPLVTAEYSYPTG